MEYFLENDYLIVKINSLGAEVKSVLKKNGYKEYMWYGDSKYWGRTSPVLFPFVGSLKNKKYTYEGIDYPMGQHGFARDMEFELSERTSDSITFTLNSNEDTLKKYPFNFVLKISYILNKTELTVAWKVENPNDRNLYFSIGAHPAFLCPIHGEKDKTGYKLCFDGKAEMIHHGNTRDTGLALMDESISLPLESGKATITADFFDRCTYMFEGNQTNIVGIEDSDGNRYVDVCFDTPLFAIWSPEEKNAPFICIEPWYGRCDSTTFDGDLTARDHTNILEPSQSFNGGYKMIFYQNGD